MQGNKGLIIGLVTGIAVLLIVAVVLTVLLVRRGGLSGGGGDSGKGETDAPVQAEVLFVVGEDIALSDVTGFEYLFSFSGGMADYHGEAWSFRLEDGTPMFRYREGNGSEVEREIGTEVERTLTEEEWETFLSCVDGGNILDQDAAYSHTESAPPGVMDGGGGYRSICSLTWDGQRKRAQDKRFEYASDRQAEELRQLVSKLQEKTEDETESGQRDSKQIAVGGYFEYSVRLPEQWENRIIWETEPAYDDGGETLDTMLTLYLKSEKELKNNAGGMLCRLAIRLNPTALPTRYEIAGTLLMDGYSVYHLTAEIPGGVQFSTSETAAEAERFYDDMEELYDSVRFGYAATWHYKPAETGHRQEALYFNTRYGYLWAYSCQADETELAARGLSACYLDAGYPDGDERMRFALHDLNGDGTNEMLVMLDEEVRAIHTIGEDGAVVLTYSCPAGSEMTVMADETIRVTSPVDGDSRTYRLTADPYGLVDAGTSQTDKPLVLQSRPMSPHAE
ncbi:MAG: hypothetical protein IJQ12_04785 [Lachnospiraceae bacterium]|nr:hypothetical protein [Lachnospiraceae bacterium]